MSDASPSRPRRKGGAKRRSVAKDESREDPEDGARVVVTTARKTPTWLKLWSLAILVNLAGFLVAIWVARLVRAVPESASTQTALMFGYYAAMAVAAFMDALLLDELAFKGAFRRTHLQGKSARFARKDADVDTVAVTMQRSTVSFPFLLLVTGALTYNLFNLSNGDFDVYQRRVGRHISALHQGTIAEQSEAVRELSIRREPAVLPALLWRLEQGGEPAVWSAWALGRFTDLPTRRPLLAPLVAATRSDDAGLRKEALVALGRLQHRTMAPAIHEEIAAARAGGETIDPRLLYALGSIQVMSSVPVLEDLLHGADPQTQRMAAWALAQHRDQQGGRSVVQLLEERLPTAPMELRCAIVHSLGILADERSNLALMAAYEDASTAERTTVCPRWQLSLRPDGSSEDRVDLFMPQETFAMKVIMSMAQMRASAADLRDEVEPWLSDLIADESTTPATREAARQLRVGIESGRDDTEMKTVEEALGI